MEFSLLGVEFRPWTPLDTCLLMKLMYFSNSWNWTEELLREYLANALQNSKLARQILPTHESYLSKRGATVISDSELGRFLFPRNATNSSELEPELLGAFPPEMPHL